MHGFASRLLNRLRPAARFRSWASAESGATSIEYLLVAATIVILFAAVRFTLLSMLQDIYKFLVQTICSPVL